LFLESKVTAEQNSSEQKRKMQNEGRDVEFWPSEELVLSAKAVACDSPLWHSKRKQLLAGLKRTLTSGAQAVMPRYQEACLPYRGELKWGDIAEQCDFTKSNTASITTSNVHWFSRIRLGGASSAGVEVPQTAQKRSVSHRSWVLI
jgi:hypothetical protein